MMGMPLFTLVVAALAVILPAVAGARSEPVPPAPRGAYSPADFGAVLDGTTPDRLALQRAINEGKVEAADE